MRKAVKIIAIITMCVGLLMSVSYSSNTSAKSTKNVSVKVGEKKTIKLPSGKFYASYDSSTNISSVGKKNAKSFTVYGILKGSGTITVVTTKNKKYTYKVSVKAPTVTKTDEGAKDEVVDEVSISGKCPYCKKGNFLKEQYSTYKRSATSTGWLREPLVSSCLIRNIRFKDSLTEDEIVKLVESWDGVILSKDSYSYTEVGFHKYVYQIVVSNEYYLLGKASDYQRSLAIKKGCEPTDLFSFGSFAEYSGYNLSEWTILPVQCDPAKQVSVPTGVVECDVCGYKFVK